MVSKRERNDDYEKKIYSNYHGISTWTFCSGWMWKKQQQVWQKKYSSDRGAVSTAVIFVELLLSRSPIRVMIKEKQTGLCFTGVYT